MKKMLFLLTIIFMPVGFVNAAPMPLDTVKMILDSTKAGWVSYRDYNGLQWIYFTQLESWKCGIKEVKFGITNVKNDTNEIELDQIWELEECNPDSPNAITKEIIYLTFPLDTVQVIDVQLTYDDDTTSGIERFKKP